MIKKHVFIIRRTVVLLMIFYSANHYSQNNELQIGLGLSSVESISNGFDATSMLFNYSRSYKKWFSLGIEFNTTSTNNLPSWFNDNVIFNPSDRFDQIVDENIVGQAVLFDVQNPINYFRSNLFLVKPTFVLNSKKKFNITLSPLLGLGTDSFTELLLISFTSIDGIITRVNDYQVISWVKQSGYFGLNFAGNYHLSEKYFVSLNSRLTSRFRGGNYTDSFGSYGYFSLLINFGYKF